MFGLILGYLPAALMVQDVELGIARVIVPLLAGLLLGLAQWLVLRGYVTRSYDWILNQAAGWVVGYALGLFVVQALSNVPFGALAGYLLFGVIVAVFQWPVLRREVPNLLSWILANVAGWTLGAFISQVIAAGLFRSGETSLPVMTLVTVGITGLVAGAVTGVVLIWIIRKPEK